MGRSSGFNVAIKKQAETRVFPRLRPRRGRTRLIFPWNSLEF